MRRILLVVNLSLGLGAACGDGSLLLAPTAAPSVTAEVASVVRGEAMELRIENHTSVDWDFWICGVSILQRFERGTWVDTPPPFTDCAPSSPRVLAGESLQRFAHVPNEFRTGPYRAKLTFRSGDRTAVVFSRVFAVR